MNWIVWILLSACFLALYDLAKKASVRENAVLPVLLCSTSCGCAAFLAALFLTGRLGATWAAADAEVLVFGALKSLLVSVSWIFTFCALRTLPITIATPIRASAPALVFFVALFLYGETPTAVQAVGMACVFSGYWVFSWAGRHEGVDFLRNHAVWCAFAGMTLSAGSALFDKYVFQVRQLPVEPVQLVFQAGLFVVYAVCLAATRVVPSFRLPHPFTWRWTIPLVGILLAFADWLYFKGLAIPDVPISVCSLLRRFSVVITFVLGALFFHETNLRRKALALLLVLLGVALLV
jgi:bacterial/archaeal transporter family protein